MESRSSAPPVGARWVYVALVGGLLVLGAGVATARSLARSTGGRGMLASITGQGAHGGRRVFVGVGGVVNSAGTGGDALSAAAHDAIAEALSSRDEVTTAGAARAQRGARAAGPRGHVFDANIQSVHTTGESTQARVSIVVSTSPAREYEFESTASVTLSGASAATPEGQADSVRRAMQRAARGAVDQILQQGAP